MPLVTHQPPLRVMDILEVLADSSDGFTLTEIADRIGSTKSTISPIVHTLAQRKFITQNKKTHCYSIGIATYCTGAAYNNGKTLLQFINTEMADIAARTGEICQMAVLDEGQVLYVAKQMKTNETIRIASFVGKRLPAYCTALGKALLSSKNSAELRTLYPNGLTAYTKRTITDFAVLERQLNEIKMNGVAYENEEITDQIECIAVPLYKQRQIFAAISIAVPSFRATTEKKELIFTVLKDGRVRIETYLNSNDMEIDSLLASTS